MSEHIAAVRTTAVGAEKTTLTFWACAIAGSQVVLNGAIMALIAPSVAHDLAMNQATTSLVVAMFSVTLAACILAGGALGDIYGRKRLLMIGLLAEGVTAVCSIFVPSAIVLLLCRAVAGISAALISPLTIAIIQATFSGEARAAAMSRYVGLLGLSAGIGIIVIQFIHQLLGWRATFGLVLLLALTALFLSRAIVESELARGRRIDWPGIILAGLGLVLLIYGLNQANHPAGFASIEVLLPVGLGLLALVLLVLYDLHVTYPVLPVRLFSNPRVVAGALLALFALLAQNAVFYHLNLYFQTLLGISPLQTALNLAPLALGAFVGSLFAARVLRRVRLSLLAPLCLLLAALGVVGLVFACGPGTSFWYLLVPLLLIGGDIIIISTMRIGLIVGSAPLELAGSASALSNSLTNLGTALGIALSSALFSRFVLQAYVQDQLRQGASQAQIQQSGKALRAVVQTRDANSGSEYGFSAQQIQALVGSLKSAYLTGLAQVFWLIAALLVLLALVSFLILRRVESKAQTL